MIWHLDRHEPVRRETLHTKKYGYWKPDSFGRPAKGNDKDKIESSHLKKRLVFHQTMPHGAS
jgi:hypothetical protein